MVEPDILADAQRELIQAGADPDAVQRALQAVRGRWGGSQVYIHAVDRESRDEAARAALQRGATIQEAAKVAGCSPSTIRRRRSDWQ